MNRDPRARRGRPEPPIGRVPAVPSAGVLRFAAALACALAVAGCGGEERADPEAAGARNAGAEGEAAEVARRARRAPGTAALRRAGCRDAMAFAADEGMAVLGAAAPPPPPGGAAVLVAVCVLEPSDPVPDCRALAEDFAAERGGVEGWIFLNAGTAEAPGSHCAGIFDVAGSAGP